MPSFTRESGGTLHVAVMGVNRIGKEPTPVSDGVMTGAETLVDEYDRFIRQLRTYVVREVLSDDDFRKLADIDLRIRRLKKERRDLRMEELAYCVAHPVPWTQVCLTQRA